MNCHRFLPVAFVLFIPAFLQAAPQEEPAKPRLVLQITVDQLRGDLLDRMADRFGEGGLKRLMTEGAHYTVAHYAHGCTMTAPGHATLFTGANPREHGIVGNEWFDPATGHVVYNCEDMEHAELGAEPKRGAGSSPKNLLGSTIGDELVVASGGRSRTFAVSVKDRGAILPAGHMGKAFWYSKNTGGFVTSDFYYSAAPEWMEAWNGMKLADAHAGLEWQLHSAEGSYRYADDREYERGTKTLGRTFPKKFPTELGRPLYSALASSPVGDELTLSFAMSLMKAERVGQGEHTDYMAIGFSMADYVGHMWGPSSREAEDNLLRLDETMRQLLDQVDELVGLENTIVVLSSDHGAPDASERLTELGADVDWVDAALMLKDANRAARDHFSVEDPLIRSHVAPYLFLDNAKIVELGLDAREVANVVSASVESQPGVAHAVPRWRLENGALPVGPLFDRLAASFHRKRSGDLWLVPEPQWQLGSGNPKAVLTSLHGSPWSYDTHIPILFMGPGIPQGRMNRPVAPRDIAPTLALMLRIKAPSVSTGEPLHELLSK
jgi:hypothetical protein